MCQAKLADATTAFGNQPNEMILGLNMIDLLIFCFPEPSHHEWILQRPRRRLNNNALLAVTRDRARKPAESPLEY